MIGGTLSVKCNSTLKGKFLLLRLNLLNSSRKDIPLCDFPGSDIYTATLEMVRLESAFEDFMHSEG